ncbi:4-(cytidine 5'-diphospho)-2-C-methyl-D-erythritol kinase [Microbacterium foliorum]|uniref:4-diphosphocytidyl-2-C-methyl-D-erythritol kinase n=1 Tax=Microbacterium foliorum TaxID=104336 RepID=A0A0F0KQQ3_9MICO|nr:4-(cytidine 5'-diphospho)-2-C-methyl-D-erythritol kinase [Microbacterium foliorum]AXL12726.1 4-(cytidine 5'-diphospho)-2-C-methyl-D-erythritol kinase [Microbacterium foliorum]KJL23232.1 4-diphosphocytidyl-2-C-methyl-D-erythritol kinase [Microbacterium foliorum]CAH0156466.1 4-diphosphocytidyl-2-C-methyl-D-erythritol kinase [Microbacterium foliorum]CAH0173527.1 4-diphosphocytidyl-2-C-methyl-D-erythritol kinase [Microbacterium foliorum]
MSTAAPVDSVRVRAPGKINVYLGVGGRHDDGYHALATVFQAVSLYEDVIARHADDFSITVSGLEDPSTVPLDDRNLAMRAAKLLATAAEYDGGVALEIRKSVPVAGGMGGGSADAAAALVACDALWGTGFSTARLHELAARLGADVPFALHGGTAVGTGRGDQLSPALARGRFDWVLVQSDGGLSTPVVYARLDALRDDEGALADDPPLSLEVPAPVLQALRSGDPELLSESIYNDLQEAALYERPDLENVILQGIHAGALQGIVSGSGPTVALLCAGPEDAHDVQSAMRAHGLETLHVHGPVAGARIIS